MRIMAVYEGTASQGGLVVGVFTPWACGGSDAPAGLVCEEWARGGASSLALSGVPKGGEERGCGAPAWGRGDQDTGRVGEGAVDAAARAMRHLWAVVGVGVSRRP